MANFSSLNRPWAQVCVCVHIKFFDMIIEMQKQTAQRLLLSSLSCSSFASRVINPITIFFFAIIFILVDNEAEDFCCEISAAPWVS